MQVAIDKPWRNNALINADGFMLLTNLGLDVLLRTSGDDAAICNGKSFPQSSSATPVQMFPMYTVFCVIYSSFVSRMASMTWRAVVMPFSSAPSTQTPRQP